MPLLRNTVTLFGLLLVCSQLLAGEVKFFAFSPEQETSVLSDKLAIASSKESYRENSSDEALAVRYALQLHEYTAISAKEKVKPRLKELKKLSAAFPENSLIKALTASTLCMSARDTWFIPSKLSRVNECIESLDQVVDSSNCDTQVVAIRAGNSIRLPERFERRAIAIADITHLLDSGELDKLVVDNIEDRLITQLVVLYGDAQQAGMQKAAYEHLLANKPNAFLLEIASDAML